jgi:hypothetical protein
LRGAQTLSGFASFLYLVNERFYLFGLILRVGAPMPVELALGALTAEISAGDDPVVSWFVRTTSSIRLRNFFRDGHDRICGRS